MRQLTSTVVYRNPWLTLREDTFVTPDGVVGVYGVVDKPDFAVVIAEQDGRFHLVEQFRYPLGRRSLEFPMGTWPAGGSGSAQELAKAELAEETGLTADSWRHLGHLHHAGGFCSQGFDLFHATGLSQGEPNREASEADMVHVVLTEAELVESIRGGGIIDAVTIAAFARYRLEPPGADGLDA